MVGGQCPYTISDECIGTTECQCRLGHTEIEWRLNYDSARGFALYPDGTPIPADQLDDSELLSQPLIGGGLAHAGMKMYRQTDADYLVIKDWLAGATLPSCNTTN